MNSEIFIFLVWGILCFNIVASYHQYRQGAYPEWSNNQNYPPNPNPAFLRQPAAINYGASPSVNYVPGPPEHDYGLDDFNFPEQKRTQSSYAQHQLQRQHVESQSDAIYPEQVPLPQVYPEPRRHLPSPDRRHESYGGHQPATWQAPPANPVYDNYSPSASRQWPPRNSHLHVPLLPKETFLQPATYPHWQSSEYEVLPQQKPYYGVPFEEQNDYNAHTSNVEATSEISDNPVQDLLASKPKVKEYLTGSHNQYIKYVHPRNTIRLVDVDDDNLLGKSKHYKSSEIINDKDIHDKVRQQENPVPNKIGNPTSISNNKSQYTHFSKQPNNREFVHHPHPVVLQDTPALVPVKNDHLKNDYNPGHILIRTNNANLNKRSTISPVAKLAANVSNNNYHPEPVFEQTHSQPHENHVVDQNTAPIRFPPMWNDNNNYKNPIEPQKHETGTTLTENDTNGKGYQNKYNQKSTNEENIHPSGNKYLNTPVHVLNNNDDTEVPAEHTINTATYYAKETDVSNASDESTVSASLYHLKQPPKTDEIGTKPRYTQHKPTEYVFDNFDQTQVSKQESDDDISNVSQYSEDGNLCTDFNNHVTTESSVLAQKDSENTNTDETNAFSDDTVFKKESNLTDTQDTNNSTVSDNDDKQLIGDSSYKDSYDSSLVTADDIVILFPVESASPVIAEFDTTKTVDEVKAEQPEKVDLHEKDKPENEPSKNEDSIENNTEEYDEVYFFDVKLVDSYIEKSSRTYVTKSGTTVENIEEVVWEHKDDVAPRKITTTKIIWNPGPDFVRLQKGKPSEFEDPDDPHSTS